MATFDQLGQIAADHFFQRRVQYAVSVAAIAVYNEDSATTGHVARKAFASQVIGGNLNINQVAFLVLTNSTIAAEATMTGTPGANIPDSDIQFAVNSLWSAFAGA
jgi:hypothetical protein